MCRTQITEARFTCVVDSLGVNITAIDWQILVGGGFQLVQNLPRHETNSGIVENIITGLLIVTDVIMNDNGNQYRCLPTETTISDTATLIVLGKTTYVHIIKCNILVYVHKIYAKIFEKEAGIKIKVRKQLAIHSYYVAGHVS